MSQTKLKKLKRLLDSIREKPRRYSELKTKFSDVKRRTLYNYLNHFEGLGLIYHEKGMWYPKEAKRKFETKQDYENALEHSKLIIFGSSTRQGAANVSTRSLIKDFCVHPEREREFFSHLKTGYPQIYEEFQKCCRVLEKKGQSIKELYYENRIRDPLKEIADELEIIFLEIENNIPLEGFCSFCPHLKVKIKKE
jgi:hypothetical protein